jgi:hypothetical protein
MNMKRKHKNNIIGLRILFVVCVSAFLSSCGQAQNRQTPANAKTDVEKKFRLSFPEYGFLLDAPCEMKDVSAYSSGNFLVNYGGVTDGNSPEKMAAYQLLVIRVPVGYKDLSKDEYEKMVDKALRMQAQRFKKYKPIKFSYEEYPGYACETTHNGYRQKGVYFVKENFIIALTVISNNNLEAKFNKFTNCFKSLTTN